MNGWLPLTRVRRRWQRPPVTTAYAVFGPVIGGQCRRVSLPSYQQSLLNGMDRALESGDPRLASMFALFTRLTLDEGPPLTERLARGPSRFALRLRATVGWVRASAAVPIVLVACLMVAIIMLGVATATGSSCPPSTRLHQVAGGKNAVCQPSANGLRK